MLDLTKMTEEEIKNYIKKLSEKELYKYIRSEHTDIKLLRVIAASVTCYFEDYYDLLSLINLPNIDILLDDKSLSSKFLECLENILLSNFIDISMYINPLEKIFDHPNTTQEMLRHACHYGFFDYIIDKLDINDPLNREILKEIMKKDLNFDNRKRALQLLKKDSNIKPKVAVVLINFNSLMSEFICYCELCNYNLTESLLQKLSLLMEELSKFREQINAEKLIFIPVFSEISEGYMAEFGKYVLKYTGKVITDASETEINGLIRHAKENRDLDATEFLKFCNWFYSCIVKIVNEGYFNKNGIIVVPKNIIFDIGFYADGYIKVEKEGKCRNFDIAKRYIIGYSMKHEIVHYINELTLDYILLQVVDCSVINSSMELGINDCSFDEGIPVSVVCLESYCQIAVKDFYYSNEKIYFNVKDFFNYTEITTDGIFLKASYDTNYYIKIFTDGTFWIGVAEKGYDGLIKCFQYLNMAQKEYQELLKQESINVLVRKNKLG